mgnify:CR=1 FL=1
MTAGIAQTLNSFPVAPDRRKQRGWIGPVSYTHLRAHETVLALVCRLLLEKKKNTPPYVLALSVRLQLKR